MSNTPHMLPCPFCGGDARHDAHADDCYFILHQKLKGSGADMSPALEVLEAWNRRAPQPVVREPLIARSLAEWHEDDGYVAWWAWNGRKWAGEPAWIGSPNCGDWPGYHTHWTPHPEQPATAARARLEPKP